MSSQSPDVRISKFVVLVLGFEFEPSLSVRSVSQTAIRFRYILHRSLRKGVFKHSSRWFVIMLREKGIQEVYITIRKY